MKKIIVGIIILIAFIVALAVYNQTPESQEPGLLAERTLTISPGKILEKDRFGNISIVQNANFNDSLSIEDLETARSVEDAQAGSALALSRGQVDFDGTELVESLIGITNEDFLNVYGYGLESGRFFSASEEANVVVITQKIKDELIRRGIEDPLGSNLNVRGTDFTIIGIMNEINTGNPAADSDWNKLLVVPFSQSDPILEDAILVEEIRVVATSASESENVARRIRAVLQESRGQEDFTVLTPDDIRKIESLEQQQAAP